MAAKNQIILPNDTQRVSIIGKTGSGKTQGGLWQLSERSYTTMPWIIFDFKRDNSIAEIPYLQEIDVTDNVPEEPGLYVVRPFPDDNEAVENFLWKVWAAENTGLFFDEGYMIGNRSKAFRAILTQGRSKHIPAIILSQRPLWMDRFVFSESDIFQVFFLTDRDDRNVVKRFVPYDVDARLPDYWSVWYDVGRNFITKLKPVPPIEQILATFQKRLEAIQPKQRAI